MKIHKINNTSLAKYLGLTLLIALSALMPRAFAADTLAAQMGATDGWDCGTASQSKSTSMATTFYSKSSNITKFEYYLNGVLRDTNSKSGPYDGIKIDCATLDNGEYHLSVKIYDASGNTAIATTLTNKDYLTFTVKNASLPSATFAVSSASTYGNKTSYPPSFVALITDKGGSVSKIEYYFNGSLVSTDSKINSQDGYRVDASTLANGQYTLTIKLYDTSGNTANAKQASGSDQAVFTIDNAASSATPVANDCSSKQQSINTIASRIITRSTAYLSTVDAVANGVQSYYSQHPTNLSNYQTLTDQIASTDKAASDALINVVSKSSISCGSDGKPDLTNFRSAVTTLQSAISDYRKTVTNLITALEK